MKYVCVLSTDNYLEGVLVLNTNLKKLGSKYPLLCLINEDITQDTIDMLDYFKIEHKTMPRIIFKNGKSFWKNSFDKINLFNLTEYEKIVYLDSDLLILENIDKFFEYEKFTMACDTPYTDEGNSAIMVIKPDVEIYNKLIQKVEEMDNPDNASLGDQVVIRAVIPDYDYFPDEYNLMKAITPQDDEYYDFLNKCTIKKRKVTSLNRPCLSEKIIHYILAIKPWMISIPFEEEHYYEYKELLDEVRVKEREYLLNKNRLLVVCFVDSWNKKVQESIESLRNQTYKNMDILFVSSVKEVKEYVDYYQLKSKVVDSFNYKKEDYLDYDYITLFYSNYVFRNDCYQRCMEKFLDYNVDCIQIGHSSYGANTYINYESKEDILENNKDITYNNYDKIFKIRVLDSIDPAVYMRSINSLGIIGTLLYK